MIRLQSTLVLVCTVWDVWGVWESTIRECGAQLSAHAHFKPAMTSQLYHVNGRHVYVCIEAHVSVQFICSLIFPTVDEEVLYCNSRPDSQTST